MDGEDGLAVSVWRDQAAYDAWNKDRDKIADDAARETKSSIDAPTFYEVEYRG